MPTIRTFGDSFLFGSGLQDQIQAEQQMNELIVKRDKDPDAFNKQYTKSRAQRPDPYSKLTWPALCAKQLNAQYRCHAFPGVSNSAIARQVLTSADAQSLNIIQWSWIDRTEYYNDFDRTWTQIRPSDTNSLSLHYYKNMHTQLQDILNNLTIISNTLRYLEAHDMTYVCHVLDQLLTQTSVEVPIQRLQQYVNPRITWFPDHTTFFEWAKLHNYDVDDNWHPLEQAHQEACNIMHSEYERYCK